MEEPTTVHPEQEGLVLQRGGEELQLQKVSDRLTLQLRRPEDLEALVQRFQPLAVRPVARGQLVEWRVALGEAEARLEQLRSQPSIRFASHVYQLELSPQTWIYLLEQLTVQFAPDVSAAEIAAIAREHQLRSPQPLDGIDNTYIYEVGPEATVNPIKIANRLMGLQAVLTAEPNVAVAMAGLYRPRDDRYRQQWHLHPSGGSGVAASAHIDVERAWDITRGSRSVVIAVSDDGFDLDHPDLQGTGKIVAPTDLKDRSQVPLPRQGDDNHGTAVAGLAVGEENGGGIVGVAPGCALMPIRTTGFLDDRSIDRLFRSAVEAGASVISCSWSPNSVYFPLNLVQKNAITRAATQGRQGKGCVVVFSAGNANRPLSGTVDERGWPQGGLQGKVQWLSGFALHPDVIAVSACTSLNRKAAYSNWGQQISVAAPSNNGLPSMTLPKIGSVSTGPVVQGRLPGQGMVTCDRTGAAGYDSGSYTDTFGGTSSSCPVVAGVAALMLSINPSLTAREVREILQSTADKIVDSQPDPQLQLRYGSYSQNGHSLWFGYGRVNAYRAVQEAQRRASSRVLRQSLRLSSTRPAAIPDAQPGGVTRTLRAEASAPLQDVQVRVEIDHEFLGDLSITLEAPGGTAVLLQGRTLGSRTQLRQTYDLLTTPALAHLLKQASAGTWQLRIVDHAPGAQGQLLRWDLVLGI